ncbi:MAG: SDR family NAD(P)-dependent oxidoreductase [Candidatus Dormibacteraeota bacterium]|nr:SDR family NAD(P)-dependent oxidoreductase [Candidatus Dormibacteraeota bacterium]
MTVHTLDGKRVLITGAGGGIAHASIAALRAGGATVTGVDIRPAGEIIGGDVRDAEAMRVAVAAAVERMGGIDILINCAGIGTAQDVGQVPGEEVRRTLDINLLGPWTTTAAALPHLLASGGHVVIVTSVLAVIALPFASAYSASKHALDAYSRCLRIEYAGRLTVSTVRPGYIKTAIHDAPAQKGVSLEGVTNEDTVEQAAAAIVRACTHRPRWVTTSRPTAVGIWFGQHFPRLVESVIIRRGRRHGLTEFGGNPEVDPGS